MPPDQLLQLLQRLITLSREKRPPPLQQLTTLLGSGDYSLLAQPPASRPFSASVLLGHSIPFIHTTAVEATSYGAAPPPEHNAIRNACSSASSFALIAAHILRQREMGLRLPAKLRPMPHVYKHFHPVPHTSSWVHTPHCMHSLTRRLCCFRAAAEGKSRPCVRRRVHRVRQIGPAPGHGTH